LLLFLGIAWLGAGDLLRKIGKFTERNTPGGIVYSVEGMSCVNCVRTVSKALEAVRGVEKCEVHLKSGSVVVYPGKDYTESEVLQALEKAGYPGRVMENNEKCCDGTCNRG
jgi:copper chaperone CopZ